jgi:hypothetical protein
MESERFANLTRGKPQTAEFLKEHERDVVFMALTEPGEPPTESVPNPEWMQRLEYPQLRSLFLEVALGVGTPSQTPYWVSEACDVVRQWLLPRCIPWQSHAFQQYLLYVRHRFPKGVMAVLRGDTGVKSAHTMDIEGSLLSQVLLRGIEIILCGHDQGAKGDEDVLEKLRHDLALVLRMIPEPEEPERGTELQSPGSTLSNEDLEAAVDVLL